MPGVKLKEGEGMTREEAKSELMQIYMSLSEEKKQALDVLMEEEEGDHTV